MKNITVIGTGYVGLVTGVLLSDFGNIVTCVDNDENKIELLKQGICPIYETGLKELIVKNLSNNRLNFTMDIKNAILGSEVIFIAVGTPSKDDGSADLSYVYDVAETIGEYIDDYKIVVDKSTVPIGTGKIVKEIICNKIEKRDLNIEVDVVSNPEFLREGTAVYDFKHPDRIVLGTESGKALEIMKEIYNPLYINKSPFVECNLETAEMIKYASNAFLATKISFINELANLCEKVGANVQKVAEAMGKDGRISPKFLHAGPGYGGSCFPKDTKALLEIAKDKNEKLFVVQATIEANEKQKLIMVDKILEEMNDIQNKTIAVLGITFKPETDDMREAPSLIIIRKLIQEGSKIRIYDPEGKKEALIYFNDIIDDITFCENEYSAIENADALVILTEWNLFRNLDINKVRELLKGKHFFDLRNIYDRKKVEDVGLKYIGVGV